jgi:xanthine/CO dehydrogenase XdhC/CoxF family maturation factor
VAVGCCEVAVAATGVAAVVHVDGGWAGVVGGGCCEVTVSAAGDVGVGGGCCGVTTAWEETEHGTGDGYS